ncbi:Kinetochore-associated protein NNF1 [Ophiocordyceps camponoti-floridani]|uniref:Kinetochore-associated protein NNF1 n=1 Tax=Ophiocordyceps camponoti-floridani TaxID=2030778 RepID=A0A8H4Q6T7_9HYPO|nr:Kinetochore-associated protein NNF1 [Ophiocordyceps camponoti-floridani]
MPAEEPPPQQQKQQQQQQQPGPRATRLHETYTLALTRTLAKISAPDVFAACYPCIEKGAGGLLAQVRAQMVGKLREKCEREFENIVVARDPRNRPRQPQQPPSHHTVCPPQILAAHHAAHLLPHRSVLHAKLDNARARNARLARLVRRQRRRRGLCSGGLRAWWGM